MSPDAVTLSDLSDSLAKDDAIPHEVTRQVFTWFGQNMGKGKWKLDISEVVKEVGKAILSGGKVRLSCWLLAMHVTCRDLTDARSP